MDNIEVIQVIKTTLARRGDGTEGNPIRAITQYWNMDGSLLFEEDPFAEKLYSAKEAHDYACWAFNNPSEALSKHDALKYWYKNVKI